MTKPAGVGWCMVVERKRNRPADSKQRQIQFVRQGESTANTKAASRTSLLDRGNEWSGVILLDMALSRWSVLEVRIHRVVDWSPLLSHQLMDAVVQGRKIWWRLETIGRQWEPTGEHKWRNIHVCRIRGTK